MGAAGELCSDKESARRCWGEVGDGMGVLNIEAIESDGLVEEIDDGVCGSGQRRPWHTGPRTRGAPDPGSGPPASACGRAIESATPFPSLTSRREDFASKITRLYYNESVGNKNYRHFLFFTHTKQFKEVIEVALSICMHEKKTKKLMSPFPYNLFGK
jgi:hypothetical protein